MGKSRVGRQGRAALLGALGVAVLSVAACVPADGAPPTTTTSTVPAGVGVPEGLPTLSFPRGPSTNLNHAAGAVGDEHNAAATLRVADEADPAGTGDGVSLSVVGSSDPSIVPLDAVRFRGTGHERYMHVIPTAQGVTDLDLKVTTDDGRERVYPHFVTYYASAASTTATARYLSPLSDRSSAIDVGDGYYVAIDDESNQLGLFEYDTTGPAVASLNVGASFYGSEMDLEGIARTGDRLYITGSLGNKKSNGKVDNNRHIFMAVDLHGTGASTTVTDVGYTKIRAAIVNWDHTNLHGLGADYFGMTASAAAGTYPNTVEGINVEGLEMAPGSSTTAYLAFRGPLEPAADRHLALILPITNIDELVAAENSSVTAAFGAPIQLDLGGRGIREIRKNAWDEYLIIAGPAIDSPDFALYRWDGDPAHSPVLDAANINTGITPQNPGSWEGVVSVPHPLVDGAQIQLIGDTGDSDLYADGLVAKDRGGELERRSPTDLVTLGAAPAQGVLRANRDAVTFVGEVPLGRHSSAAQVLLSNTGATPVTITSATVSAGFTVADNTCATPLTLAATAPETCAVDVTFDPTVAGPSTGTLTIVSDASNSAITIPLAGRASAAVTAGPATAPRSPDAIGRAGEATLWWAAPSDPGEALIDSYVVTPYLEGVPQSPVTTPDATTRFELTGLTPAARYTFTVAAHSAAGLGPVSLLSDEFIATPIPAEYSRVLVAGNGEQGATGDGGPALEAAITPNRGMATDSVGNIYFSDQSNRVRKISTDGTISTVAGTGNNGSSGDGGPAVDADVRAYGLAIDANDDVYFSDGVRIRKIDTSTGIISAFAGADHNSSDEPATGDGGPALDAIISSPDGLEFDSAGNLFLTDRFSQDVRKVSTDGTISTLAPHVGTNGIAVDPSGNVYVGNYTQVYKVSPAGTVSLFAGRPDGAAGSEGVNGPVWGVSLDNVGAVAADDSGNVFIGDIANYRVLKVAPNGTTTIVTTVGPAWSMALAVDADQRPYVAENNIIVRLDPPV